MNIDRVVFAFAGTMILVSLALGMKVSPYWFLLTAFVGLNMLQAAFTGFCPLAVALGRLGLRPGAAFAGGSSCQPSGNPRQVKLVDVATALDWFRQGQAIVVDVREKNEYAAGHIPGAVSVPLSEFDAGRVPFEAGKQLVFHCQSGRRCGPAAAKMIEQGFAGQINRLQGGFGAWVRAGGPAAKEA